MGQAKGRREALDRARRLARSRDQLVRDIKTQLRFLRRSAEAFDLGDEDEAKRMAAVIRTLLHDRGQSRSVLAQLDLLPHLRLLDSATKFDPRNLISTLGLVALQMTIESEGGSARYVAPFGDRPNVGRRLVPFDTWWTRIVASSRPYRPETQTVSRKDLVLALANREGGVHVDPLHDPSYRELAMENGFGFVYRIGHESDDRVVEGDPVAASVRQIAYEVETSLADELPRLLPDIFLPQAG